MAEKIDCNGDVRVLSTSIATRANGEKTIIVQIGFETAIIEPKKDEPARATISLQIPGAPQNRPVIPLELKASLFFTEKEWDKAKDKFIVGERIGFEFTKKGVEIVRC